MDNTPGVTWAGDIQTDFGDFGVYDDAFGSVWGPGPYVPPALDPTLSNAARVNYAGRFAGGAGDLPFNSALSSPAAEGFASNRVRFSENPLLARRRDALVESLMIQEAAADTVYYDQSYDDAGVTNGSDPYGQQLVGYGAAREAFGSPDGPGPGERLRLERLSRSSHAEPDGLLSGILSDRDLLVFIFVMLIFLVLQGVVAGAVASALGASRAKALNLAPSGAPSESL